MLIHERFVFIHMPKTAGVFLASALRRELPRESLESPDARPHAGWDEIPEHVRDRPALGYVRNPWDWYVSWYHFLRDGGAENPAFRRFSADGANDFATTVRNACRDGLYMNRFLRLFGGGLDSERLTVGRFEALLDDLEAFLERVDVDLSAGGMARIRRGERLNFSRHRPYREYYDDGLRDLVGDSCRALIDRFGYRF